MDKLAHELVSISGVPLQRLGCLAQSGSQLDWADTVSVFYSIPPQAPAGERLLVLAARTLSACAFCSQAAALLAYSWRTPSFLLIPLGTLPTILYRLESGKKSALLTDILALSFAHEAMSMMKLDSFKTGCILLSGLFLYDIWWVFGTKVVSVILWDVLGTVKLTITCTLDGQRRH